MYILILIIEHDFARAIIHVNLLITYGFSINYDQICEIRFF